MSKGGRMLLCNWCRFSLLNRARQAVVSVHASNIRLKSDDKSKSGDIVVEKEKQVQSRVRREMNWGRLPEKLAEFRQHFEELFKHPSKQKMRGRGFKDDEILYYFREKEDLENWFVVTDETIGGKSWAEFVQGDNEMTSTFRGYISQKLPTHMLPSAYDKLESKPYYRGFACLETMPFMSILGREDLFSVHGFNSFEIRLRGDGRKYMFQLLCDYDLAEIMYHIPIHTRGGPMWETVKLPFAKFIATKNSTHLFRQVRIGINEIRCFRFLLLDTIQGPFQLELDYIALTKDFTENLDDTDYHDPFSKTNQSIGTW